MSDFCIVRGKLGEYASVCYKPLCLYLHCGRGTTGCRMLLGPLHPLQTSLAAAGKKERLLWRQTALVLDLAWLCNPELTTPSCQESMSSPEKQA